MIYCLSDCHDELVYFSHYRPLIQGKLDVLSQAGLSKDDFSTADSTFMKVRAYCVVMCMNWVCL